MGGGHANTEAQFGSSGSVHGEGEMEKEESYRTKLQLFSFRTFTAAFLFHERGEGKKRSLCVCMRGEAVFLQAFGVQPEPKGPSVITCLGNHRHIVLIMTEMGVISRVPYLWWSARVFQNTVPTEK